MPALGWRPSDFWTSSLIEFQQAVEGFQDMNGGSGRSGFTDEDRDEVERLKAKYG